MYDLLIIGGGPAGYAAALRAAQLGGRVLLVEAKKVGGTCLHRGCIPAKVLYKCASAVDSARDALIRGLLAGNLKVTPEMVSARRQEVVSGLYQGLLLLLQRKGIETITGTARLLGPTRIAVEGKAGTREILANNILIATGSQESSPAFPGAKLLRGVEDSLSPPEELCRVVIVGGGNSGLELGSAYASLGYSVTIIEQGKRILPALPDDECGKWLGFMFRRRGITVYTGTVVVEARQADRKIHLTVETAGAQEKIEADLAIAATGRLPYLGVLAENFNGLEKNQSGGIRVNERQETSMPGVYAAGDVTGPPMLAHLAYAEGIAAAENALGMASTVDCRAVPQFVSANPEAAWVGMTEKEASLAGLRCKVGMFPFAASGIAQVDGRTGGFVKLVALQDGGLVVGMQVIGGRASEMIMEGVLAIRQGLTFAALADAIHPHPTFSEAVWEAALALKGSTLHAPGR